MNVRPENTIIETVYSYLKEYDLFIGGGGILIAVSGGRDSLALIHILHQLKTIGQLSQELYCVHLNHQLRGQESDDDAKFVRLQAQELGIPFITDTLPVRAYASSQKRSIETAARELRLEKLQILAKEHSCQTIATGHHFDDNAETVIFRLLRGTGFRGLAGIHPKTHLSHGLCIIRPLLCLRRDEITSFLQAQNQTWREDHTNQHLDFKRNFIRHSLLPELQKSCNQSLPTLLNNLAAGAYLLQNRIDQALHPLWSNHISEKDNRIQINCYNFKTTSPWLQIAWLQKALTALGCGLQNIDQHHYQQLVQLGTHTEGPTKHALPNGFIAERIDNTLVITKLGNKADLPPPLPTQIKIPGITTWGGIQIEAQCIDPGSNLQQHRTVKSPNVEWLDSDRLEEPLVIRTREPGDRFYPLGTKGSRKVGKFLTDLSLTPKQRQKIAIIADRKEIVWVAPHRLSERVKITDQTQSIVQLTFRTV